MVHDREGRARTADRQLLGMELIADLASELDDPAEVWEFVRDPKATGMATEEFDRNRNGSIRAGGALQLREARRRRPSPHGLRPRRLRDDEALGGLAEVIARTRLWRSRVLAAALLVAAGGAPLLVPIARAEHDGTCHAATRGNVQAVWLTIGFFQPHGDTSLTLSLGRGDSRPRARVRDGTSNTFLVGEVLPIPACADLDRDGVPGITEVAVVVYAGRSPAGEGIEVVVVPAAGEIDTPGWHPATAFVARGDEVFEIDGVVRAAAERRPARR